MLPSYKSAEGATSEVRLEAIPCTPIQNTNLFVVAGDYAENPIGLTRLLSGHFLFLGA